MTISSLLRTSSITASLKGSRYPKRSCALRNFASLRTLSCSHDAHPRHFQPPAPYHKESQAPDHRRCSAPYHKGSQACQSNMRHTTEEVGRRRRKLAVLRATKTSTCGGFRIKPASTGGRPIPELRSLLYLGNRLLQLWVCEHMHSVSRPAAVAAVAAITAVAAVAVAM